MKFKFKKIIANGGNVFLRRLSIYLKKGSIKVHLITGDDSPEYHTHPWNFTSFILFGGYKEYLWIPGDRWAAMKAIPKRSFIFFLDLEDSEGITIGRECKTGYVNIKDCNQQHRVELFTLFGVKVPCVTVGWYSEKKQLCSFCKEAGYCKSNKKQ